MPVTAGPDAEEWTVGTTSLGRGGLLSGQSFPALAAVLGAVGASLWKRPFRLGSYVIAARHADVTELLARDLDFLVGPVNATAMNAVNGPFVLGMDRGARLAGERRALYAALARVDMAALGADVATRAAARLGAHDDAIDIVEEYARPVAAETAQRLFGVRGPDLPALMDVTRTVFGYTFLSTGSDPAVAKRSLAAGALMQRWLAHEIARRRADNTPGDDMMGELLADGTLDDEGVRRTLGGMLVGSVDTTASSVAKIVSVIVRDPALALRVEADAHDAPERLYGWCLEALRRWPHNPIVLRKAARDTDLAGTRVRAGDRVFAWTQAAMRDPAVFPRPDVMTPDRPRHAYLHFGGGLHPCAGRAVNAFQIPVLVGALAKRGFGTLGPIGWAGPFPARARLTFRKDRA